MKQIQFIIVLFLFWGCQKEDDRCGTIIQKTSQGDSYIFVLQTDLNFIGYGEENLPNIPDEGVRQGRVSKEVFESFELGDEYCSMI